MIDRLLQSLGLRPEPQPVGAQALDESRPLVCEELALSYGDRLVLHHLDWRLQRGQVVGLLGRNGAGKTTLIETLLGLRDPQRGQARLFGQKASQIDDAVRARIGYVPQQNDLFPDLSARQLLAYFRSFYPRWNEAKVEGLLSRWEIPQAQPIAQLSGGQQQRLSIIRALAHEPDLLVLDEPVSSLDPLARRDFLRELVEQVVERGTTVLFSTHILSDLERVAFQVAFLRDGRVAFQAPLDELLERCRWVEGALPPDAHSLVQQRGRHLVLMPNGESGVGEPVNLEDLFEALA